MNFLAYVIPEQLGKKLFGFRSRHFCHYLPITHFVHFIRINYWAIFNKFGTGHEEPDFKYLIYQWMGRYIGNTCIKISENQFEKIIFWNQIVSDIKAFSHISVHMTMDSDSLNSNYMYMILRNAGLNES